VSKEIFCPTEHQPKKTVALERGGVYIASNVALLLESMVKTIQAHAPPDRSILVLPYQPMIYFLAQRHNPTRWNYLWPGDQTAEDHRRLIEQAMHDAPAAVLIFGRSSVERYAADILEYVDAHYRLAKQWGPNALYLPVDVERR
jgi:hypothetical protein